MHRYRWHSNIKWGPFYDPETEAHYASASDIETLMAAQGGPTDRQTIQVHNGERYVFAANVAEHCGGFAKHWHGEPF